MIAWYHEVSSQQLANVQPANSQPFIIQPIKPCKDTLTTPAYIYTPTFVSTSECFADQPLTCPGQIVLDIYDLEWRGSS